MGWGTRLGMSATGKLIAEYPDCCLCAGQNAATTREHMPPKSLFGKITRPDKLVMPSCSPCNNGTSTADLTASIVSHWSYADISEADHAVHAKLAHRIRRQAPEILREWTSISSLGERLRAKRHLRTYGVPIPDGVGLVAIKDETIRQLNVFAYKATLALYWEHFRRPLGSGAMCYGTFKTKEDFAAAGPPRNVLELLPQYASLTQGEWNTREIFEYRHGANRDEGLFGFFARFRSGLYVSGFVVEDPGRLPNEPEGWLRSGPDLLARVAQLTRRQ